MRIAIISDIHANIHALEAVWEDLRSKKPDAVYCLGDLVGYGAYPNEVVEFIRDQEIPTVMGNYDEGVAFDLNDCGCVYRDKILSELGTRSLLWSRGQTSQNNKEFLQRLPIQRRFEVGRTQLLLVHGSPRKINEYLYQDRPKATFERIAKLAGCDVLVFGHTHLPYTKKVARTLFANAGTVGKPKEGDPRASYLLLTLKRKPKVEVRRVSYDVASAAQAIRSSELPNEFANMLETGGLQMASERGLVVERSGL